MGRTEHGHVDGSIGQRTPGLEQIVIDPDRLVEHLLRWDSPGYPHLAKPGRDAELGTGATKGRTLELGRHEPVPLDHCGRTPEVAVGGRPEADVGHRQLRIVVGVDEVVLDVFVELEPADLRDRSHPLVKRRDVEEVDLVAACGQPVGELEQDGQSTTEQPGRGPGEVYDHQTMGT